VFSSARADCNTCSASAPKHAHGGSKDSEFDPWGSPSGFFLHFLELRLDNMPLAIFWIDEGDLKYFDSSKCDLSVLQ
jgi:hypothetical protein